MGERMREDERRLMRVATGGEEGEDGGRESTFAKEFAFCFHLPQHKHGGKALRDGREMTVCAIAHAASLRQASSCPP
ncbi:unnamed protein product [Caenorhabditis auriculariae]|uniref:Uncharacterized protein n=1 Tax=Caenorhabditis auriculariae TaxID=2777116 RepID=A0A8S1HCE2_9PELO|nr:unnamed protein product [Caenorhabditis auriculariae]